MKISMDSFDLHKAQCLSRKDASKIGCIDRSIIEHVKLINSHSDYYTTSSCGGRIVLFAKDDGSRKCDGRWLYVTHGKASPAAIRKALSSPQKELVWFRQEAFILHVAARDLAAAKNLLAIARQAGLKHSGIFSLQSRIILEIEGNEHMDVPIKKGGKLIAPEAYITELVRIANRKMDNNMERLNTLLKYLKEL